MVLEFLLMFHAAKPGDWLLDNLLSTMMCGKDTKHRDCVKLINSVARDIKPSQFQHIGYHSSLSGKIQKLKDKNFGVKVNKQVPTHQNPAASGLSTTMTIYRGYALTPAYNGTSFFWATTPKVGDTIDIVYSPPISISRFRLVSGSHDHPSDIFPASTVVEVLTEQAAFSTIQSTNSTFAHVTKFNPVGVAEANSTSALGKIHTFRIRVTEVIQTWVILKQIELYS
ncbi:alpha-1,3-mannosyl-glycoprotein 4-beta-N-acetylglucosaminyltransferase A [Aplysia californica]|uniref:Alpha-1,3-mannosyl-glycoprotein 4-beta-N-acetylglucosaminyltransferase A n=1 Tax=Aplysia californica TaxID=6500 RepID=A0ABM1A8C0_APLCA|nr:alpha-1,3-mannosyl-glycoprotein 4-beta-N-acetylglucosaminyltransferase A [Aplysia californica]